MFSKNILCHITRNSLRSRAILHQHLKITKCMSNDIHYQNLASTKNYRFFSEQNQANVETEESKFIFEEDEVLYEETLKEQILKASLIHVSKSGFNDVCLTLACNDLNLSSASSRLIEKGPIEIVWVLIDKFYDNFDKKMNKTDFSEMTKDEIISYGIKLRLNQLKLYINYWDEAMALLMHPSNAYDSAIRLNKFANRL